MGVVSSDCSHRFGPDDVAHLLLDLQDHETAGIDPRRHRQDHARVAKLDRIDDRVDVAGDGSRRLDGDRHLVADLQPGGLIVQNQELRCRDHVDVRNLLERAQDDAHVGIREQGGEAWEDSLHGGVNVRLLGESRLEVAGPEEPLHAVAQLVRESHLRDRRLDHHLERQGVKPFDGVPDLPVVGGQGADHE